MFTSRAGTVAEGLTLLRLEPAFIALDLHLPDGLGTTILQYVRQKKLPISVAIATGSDDQTFLSEVEAMKPDRILRKPYALEDLLEWIGAAKAAQAPAASAGSRSYSQAV
jgi:DNA-binding response OmpR family regulator